MAIMYLLTLGFFGGFIYVLVAGYDQGLLPFGIAAGVGLAICVFGSWFYYKHPIAKYEVRDVQVLFSDPDYFVPPDEFASFLERIAGEFEDHWGDPPISILRGVTIRFVKNKPRHPTKGETVGLSWPLKQAAEVWAPHVLNPGGAGYELKLLACHRINPGFNEGQDIDWMRKHGIM
jgi:hypothetical protein